MGKRVRLTDDSLNSHGSRVLTSGVDASQYILNPVLLYMHERGKVIGYMKDIEVKDGEITGEPVFDCATELSKQCKKQWEVGSLRMVSIGIDVLELSEKPEHLVAGQTAPTITKSKIFETSIVDIGANDNAIVMRHNGKQITLGRDSENPLPMLSNKPQKTEPKMELKTLALQLGLPETADEATVNAEIAKLKASKDDTEKVRKENEELKLAQITAAVDAAVAEKKIPTEKKEHFINIGKKLGIDELKETLAAMSPQVKISSIIESEPEHKETLAKSPWEERMEEIRKNLKK
ncbi:HK97 family phage prohead protease [Duncaniella muris]|uniref:HK97 family phage prohead protease n=1 Tax=Duncaniella muris TaxID=2094150 RepID=UPI0025AA0E73|nr:HK97 family phage prohead protease [Duncaniella muris]